MLRDYSEILPFSNNSIYFPNPFQLINYKLHSFIKMSHIIVLKINISPEKCWQKTKNLKITVLSKNPVLSVLFSSLLLLLLFCSFFLSFLHCFYLVYQLAKTREILSKPFLNTERLLCILPFSSRWNEMIDF